LNKAPVKRNDVEAAGLRKRGHIGIVPNLRGKGGVVRAGSPDAFNALRLLGKCNVRVGKKAS
jgi:hypothetical protein